MALADVSSLTLLFESLVDTKRKGLMSAVIESEHYIFEVAL